MQPLLRKGDIGRPPFEQFVLQQELYLREQILRLSLRDLESNLTDYNQIYLLHDFDRISAYLVFADRTLDFAVAGGLHPEFDFAGKPLQNLATPDRLDFLTYSALPFKSGGVIALVWDSTRGSSCVQLTRSLDNLAASDVPDALVRITFEHFENTYADPRWWEGMDGLARQHLLHRMAIAASNNNRKPNCLVNDGIRTARWQVIAREWR